MSAGRLVPVRRATEYRRALDTDAARRGCAECHPLRLAGDGRGGFGFVTVCPWPAPCVGPVADRREATG